jgi:hypothetical protein
MGQSSKKLSYVEQLIDVIKKVNCIPDIRGLYPDRYLGIEHERSWRSSAAVLGWVVARAISGIYQSMCTAHKLSPHRRDYKPNQLNMMNSSE